jgi:hypothetical protein
MAKAATPKRRATKKTFCGECNITYEKGKVDWLSCDFCKIWFDLPCSGADLDTFIRLSSDRNSIWLCKVCLPNLVNLPSNTTMTTPSTSTVPTSVAMDGPAAAGISNELCAKVEKVLEECSQTFSQHASNLRLPEQKIHESFVKVQSANGPAASNQQSNSSRFANQNRLIITNVPANLAGSAADRVVLLARHIGANIGYADIDTCNQLTKPHPSNSAPIFVRFLSRIKRNEFYSRYLHLASGGRMVVGEVFPAFPNDTRRLYVAEHLTPANTAIFKEARFLRRKRLVAQVRTRNGAVLVTPLNSDREFVVESPEDLLMTKNFAVIT